MLPPNEKLVICFAHVAYRLHQRFSALNTGVYSFAVRDPETLENRVGEAHVLVISGLWQNGLLDRATKLRFIQAIGAGTDQFPHEELAKRSIRLASARGVNYRAVSEHAMALILALSRRLPEARDNQGKRVWRSMIGDLSQREDELGGKSLLSSGSGRSADASPSWPKSSICASSGCGAIRPPAAAWPTRCIPWPSSSPSCPRPISSPSLVPSPRRPRNSSTPRHSVR